MINHYLQTLTPDEEHRVLTGRLSPGMVVRNDGTRCLIGAVEDWGVREGCCQPRVARHGLTMWYHRSATLVDSVARRFDALCHRFGVERIGRVIRERIVANQIRRTVAPVTQPAEV